MNNSDDMPSMPSEPTVAFGYRPTPQDEPSLGSAPTAVPGGASTPCEPPQSLGRIDQYELIRKLGGGGFGVVYLARDTVSGIDVALKTLHPLMKSNAEEMERLREKFALVSRLSHPNIASALVLHPVREVMINDAAVWHELRLSPGDSVMVMRYAPGITLSKWRRQFTDGVVPMDMALEVGRQIAAALDYAHGERIVHRDIKPANVMVETLPTEASQPRSNSQKVSSSNSPSADHPPTIRPSDHQTIRPPDHQTIGPLDHPTKICVRILDFGLAAEIRSSMSRVSTEIGDTSGTRPYMAPEQWLGKKQDGRTDQYALACVLYELLSGEPPFAGVFETGDPAIMMQAVKGESPDEIDGVSPAVNAALLKALSKNPKDRFDSCTEFVEAISHAEACEKTERLFCEKPEAECITKDRSERKVVRMDTVDSNTLRVKCAENVKPWTTLRIELLFGVSVILLTVLCIWIQAQNQLLPVKDPNPTPSIIQFPDLRGPTRNPFFDALGWVFFIPSLVLIWRRLLRVRCLMLCDYKIKWRMAAIILALVIVACQFFIGAVFAMTHFDWLFVEDQTPVSVMLWPILTLVYPVGDVLLMRYYHVPISATKPTRRFALPWIAAAVVVVVGGILLILGVKTVESKPAESEAEHKGPTPGERGGDILPVKVGGVSFYMRWCPAGSFLMGSTNGNNDEKPQHKVTLSKGFWIGETEVTQRLWKEIMGNNPSDNKAGDDYPVENVSWNYCQEFVAKLNARADVKEAGIRFALPTEAQWEYACRAGTTGDYGGNGWLDDMGWYGKILFGKTHPVAQKKPNDWGLYDMHGNVAEWCADEYSAGYYENSPAFDPPGAWSLFLSSRVLRGGGYWSDAQYCRSACRSDFRPDERKRGVGLRLAASGMTSAK